MSLDEQPDDDSRQTPRAPFVPPESWIEAFDEQCTSTTLKRLRRYAAMLARIAGRDVGNDYAEELVQNALTDTMCGTLRWDPEAEGLEPYLITVIRLRARRDRRRVHHYHHVYIDAYDPGDPAMELADVEAALAVEPAALTKSAEHEDEAITRTMTDLRERACGDPQARRFLNATYQGATTKAQIMRLAELTNTEYHNTRRRLARLVEQLTADRTDSTKED